MDDYISREAVLKRFEQLKDQTESLRDKLYLDGVAAVIDTLPAADIAPVIRAKWNVILSCDDWKIKCSNCGRTFDRFVNGAVLPEHCFCGAKMDLEESK